MIHRAWEAICMILNHAIRRASGSHNTVETLLKFVFFQLRCSWITHPMGEWYRGHLLGDETFFYLARCAKSLRGLL
jgi:hypothetical protein